MTHAITRTSPKAGPFLGTCVKCGQTNLGIGAPLEPCPMDAIVSDEKVLIDMIDGKYSDARADLKHLGTDGARWAAEFRVVALNLGYSDMDEGWLIGWFCNAIMAGYDAPHPGSGEGK